MLKNVGIWDEYGANGWSIAGKIKKNILRSKQSNHQIHYNITYPKVSYNLNIFIYNNSYDHIIL